MKPSVATSFNDKHSNLVNMDKSIVFEGEYINHFKMVQMFQII